MRRKRERSHVTSSQLRVMHLRHLSLQVGLQEQLRSACLAPNSMALLLARMSHSLHKQQQGMSHAHVQVSELPHCECLQRSRLVLLRHSLRTRRRHSRHKENCGSVS